MNDCMELNELCGLQNLSEKSSASRLQENSRWEKIWVALKRAVCFRATGKHLYLLLPPPTFGVAVFLGRRTAWMLGRTPPWAIVTPDSSLLSSSSLRMASW